MRRESGRWAGVAMLGLGLLGLAGCRVESSGQGDTKKVRVVTPFGGVQVKTGEQAVERAIGLPVYPGATLARDGDGKDDSNNNGVADVDLNFGEMRLRVKALSYRTGDAPDKVREFYRKQLGRYGVVIACVNDRPAGEPARTPEGLTCDKNKEGGDAAGVNVDLGNLQLKAGSPQHQHLVSIEPEGSGTKFGLVVLDLPHRLTDAAAENDGEK